MLYALVALGALLVLLIAFVCWRLFSVVRGASQRDDRIALALEPVADRLTKKQSVSPSEIAGLAQQPHLRSMLYNMLKHFERLDLFPREHLSTESQAAAELAQWMMHPHELGDPPQTIELLETVARQLGTVDARFLVFRFRMSPGHWSADDGWLIGLAGPYIAGEVPYATSAGGFSRAGDKYGEVQPRELVDWYVRMAIKKGAPWAPAQ